MSTKLTLVYAEWFGTKFWPSVNCKPDAFPRVLSRTNLYQETSGVVKYLIQFIDLLELEHWLWPHAKTSFRNATVPSLQLSTPNYLSIWTCLGLARKYFSPLTTLRRCLPGKGRTSGIATLCCQQFACAGTPPGSGHSGPSRRDSAVDSRLHE